MSQVEVAINSVENKGLAVGSKIGEYAKTPLFSDADKNGTFEQRVKWIINTAFKSALYVVEGVVATMARLVGNIDLIVTYFMVGIVLYVIRVLLLALCPPLASISGVLADIIDAIITFLNVGFNALYDGVNIIMSFINKDVIGLINDIAKIVGQRGVGQVNFNGLRWRNINGVSPQQVRDFLNAVPPTCSDLGSMVKIMGFLIEMVSAASVCPVVRYMYPLEQTYDTHVFDSVFGWLYPGSADPILFNNMTNCVAASARTNSVSGPEVTCLFLGIPFLYLELFLPIILLRCIFPSFWPAISSLLSIVFYFFEEFLDAAVEIVAVFFKSVVLF